MNLTNLLLFELFLGQKPFYISIPMLLNRIEPTGNQAKNASHPTGIFKNDELFVFKHFVKIFR